MPHRLCPFCRVQGRLLEDTSKEALVEYYRCDKCGRIWTHRKADPNSPEKHVTFPAKPPKAS
jgi:Zn-finger nucleic acid-binding protein